MIEFLSTAINPILKSRIKSDFGQNPKFLFIPNHLSDISRKLPVNSFYFGYFIKYNFLCSMVEFLSTAINQILKCRIKSDFGQNPKILFIPNHLSDISRKLPINSFYFGYFIKYNFLCSMVEFLSTAIN